MFLREILLYMVELRMESEVLSPGHGNLIIDLPGVYLIIRWWRQAPWTLSRGEALTPVNPLPSMPPCLPLIEIGWTVFRTFSLTPFHYNLALFCSPDNLSGRFCSFGQLPVLSSKLFLLKFYFDFKELFLSLFPQTCPAWSLHLPPTHPPSQDWSLLPPNSTTFCFLWTSIP